MGGGGGATRSTIVDVGTTELTSYYRPIQAVLSPSHDLMCSNEGMFPKVE